MTYERIKAAAEALVVGDSKGSWALGDALLDHIPSEKHAGQRPPGGALNEALEKIARDLARDGVFTQNDDPYTAKGLDKLRNTALAWPPEDRYPNVAYRTHREVEPKSGDGRRALADLYAAATSGDWAKPDEWDDATWTAVGLNVRSKVKRGNTFIIAANDIRRLLGQKANTPARDDEAKAAEAEAVKASAASGELAGHLTPEQKASVAQSAVKDARTAVRKALKTVGITDESAVSDLATRSIERVNTGKADTIEEAANYHAEWERRHLAAEARKAESEKDFTVARWLGGEVALRKVREAAQAQVAAVRSALSEVSGVEFDDDMKETLADDLASTEATLRRTHERVQAALELIRLHITGDVSVDWDAELVKLGGGE